MQYTIRVTGLNEAIAGFRRMQSATPEAQRAEVRRLGDKHLAMLKAAAPLGKGENPGALRAGFELTFQDSGTAIGYRISNKVAHLKYILRGRPAVHAKKGKALRFVIAGRVFYRKSVGPAAPNRFDQPVRQQMQPEIHGAGLRIRTRVVAAYKGGV
jgi:hypothetical protein